MRWRGWNEPSQGSEKSSCTAGRTSGWRQRPRRQNHGTAAPGEPEGRPGSSGGGSDCRGSRCSEPDEYREGLVNKEVTNDTTSTNYYQVL